MSIDALQETTLGTWKSPPYQITLHTSEENLWAEAGDSTICFSGKQIKWGIIQTIPQQALIDKIRSLSPGEIAIFHYPKENPTELWVFEARPMVGTQIRQGKEYLIQAQNNPLLYEKALANFETALKLQKKVNGNTVELEQIISQIKNKIQELEFYQNALLYLPTDEEKEKFGENVELYKENICISFENLLSVEESFSPHHHLMSALVHEEKREFLLAIDDYLNLSENNPYALACFEKAYTLLDLAQPQDLLNIKESIRIAFEKRLRELGQQEKAPTCFICFNTSEKDVGEWLEKTLVPDLDLAGIKPIFCYKDLSQGQDLDNFHELGRNADLVIIACTPGLKTKYEERKKAPVGVAMEIKMIKGRYKDPDKVATIFPLYLKGRRKDSLPTAYFESVFGAKFSPFKPHSFEFNYFSSAFDLFSAMRSVSRDISRRAGEEFLADAKQILKGKYNVEEVTLWREEQTKRIQALRETIAHRISAHTQVINLPLPPKDFTGREKELTDLHEACRNGHRVAVTGLGGMGKTALALKYGENYKSHYQFIHFMPAGTPELAVDGLLRLADDLHIPKSKNVEERLQWLKTKLDRFEREYLLIFDGMDQIEVFHKVDKYLPERGRCLLLTSRMPEEAHIRGFAILNLKRLSIEEAVDYLLLVTGSQEKKEAEQLAEKLGCLPLALKHAAGYIRQQRAFTIQNYIKLFDKYELELFEDGYLTLTNEEKTILKTWDITLKTIEEVDKSPLSKEIIRFFSFMGQAPIPMKLIKSCIDGKELELNHALKSLCNYSMIDSSSMGTYDVHPLVQDVTQFQLPSDEKRSYLNFILTIFLKFLCQYDPGEISKWPFLRRLIPHFNKIELHIKKNTDLFYSNEAYLFFSEAGFFLKNEGLLSDSLARYRTSSEIGDKIYSTDFEKRIKIYVDLGEALFQLGQFKDSFVQENLALECLKKAGNINADLMSRLYNNIGMSLKENKRNQEALHYLQLSLGIRQIKKDESDLALSYNNIGLILRELEEYPEALKYSKLALQIRERCPSEKINLAGSYQNVGFILSDLGKHKEALKYEKKAITTVKKFFSDKHPSLASMYNNIGMTLQALKRWSEVEEHLTNALKISIESFGEHYFLTANIYDSIGVYYMERALKEKAIENFNKSLGIREKLFGEASLEIALSYNNIAEYHRSKGDFTTALRLDKRALTIRKAQLGGCHSLVACSYSNIGNDFCGLKQEQNAGANFKAALEIFQKIGDSQVKKILYLKGLIQACDPLNPSKTLIKK